MTTKEKELMINEYKKQFSFCLSFNNVTNQYELDGMRRMMFLFFEKSEILNIENTTKVTKEHHRDLFLNIESWLRQIHNNFGGDVPLFEWGYMGVRRIYNSYDWVFELEEYKGFLLAIEDLKDLCKKNKY